MAQTILLASETISCEPAFRPRLPVRTRTLYVSLWHELQRQRAALVRESGLGGLQMTDPELLSDWIDQATVDQERDLCVQAKERVYRKLHHVDLALQRMKQRTYGSCIRCAQEIPFARLKVQPASLTCIFCQEQAEHEHHDTKFKTFFEGQEFREEA